MQRIALAVVLALGCGRGRRPIGPVEPAPLPWPSQAELDAVFEAQERARIEGLQADGFLITYEGPGDEEMVEARPEGQGGQR